MLTSRWVADIIIAPLLIRSAPGGLLFNGSIVAAGQRVLATSWEEQEISSPFGWTIAAFVPEDRDLGGVDAHWISPSGAVCMLDLSEVTISAMSWPINSQ
jgi:hypothetical protein